MPSNRFTTQDFPALAREAVNVIVTQAIRQAPEEGMLVLHDADSPLACVLASAYREAFPWATVRLWQGSEEDQEAVKRLLHDLPAKTLVVLVQSLSFRLNAFRIRLELFARGLKTIEHVHLTRMGSEEEQARYLSGLCATPSSFTTHANHIVELLQKTNRLEIRSQGGASLRWESALEAPKRNTGDYSGMTNIGGTFPIGEVFTEAKDVFTANGEVRVFALADQNFHMQRFEPFVVQIMDGLVVLRGDEPQLFRDIITQIQTNERPLVREIGFGLNPAFGKDAFVTDVTAFERQRGVHLSLGEKHGVYPKPGLMKRDDARYHVDVFVDVESVHTDGGAIYENGAYVLADAGSMAS